MSVATSAKAPRSVAPESHGARPALVARYLARETVGLALSGVALFWAAGTVAWPMGWVVWSVLAAWVIATAVVVLTVQPGLLAERLGPRVRGERWDRLLLPLLGLANLARLIVAGLDRRNGWTPASEFPLGVMGVAAAMGALGYALFVWALSANAHFTQQVRVEPERGQQVVESGPYRFVRHPGYAGALVFELFSPLALGSWWVALPAGMGLALLVVRTALEDRALTERLPGYREYAGRTRWRLIPGLW
jgi:protein-S-isoprenylcysteine O-methyltransferase Ste14